MSADLWCAHCGGFLSASDSVVHRNCSEPYWRAESERRAHEDRTQAAYLAHVREVSGVAPGEPIDWSHALARLAALLWALEARS